MSVYVARRQSDGMIKIGCSTHPTERIRKLSGTHGPMALLCVLPGSFNEERALHREFCEFEEKREWFRPAPRLQAFIAAQPTGGPLGEGRTVSFRHSGDLAAAVDAAQKQIAAERPAEKVDGSVTLRVLIAEAVRARKIPIGARP